ncbi:hypothetical protein AXF42_Ash015968 [Apostasia shenzhenica]|uniref:Uncharacterized protein n=1 Tax=Apostasia shenzhenica TaxID=1088818 RepID=A0A2I0AWK2_9ASPA|nr:hypothetical protein AXF42_Ash015968 [Apostasia shenzhenica]
MEWGKDKPSLGLRLGFLRLLCRPLPLLPSSPPPLHPESKAETPNTSFQHAMPAIMENAEGFSGQEIADSDCSSGCQSGWTLYLGHQSQGIGSGRVEEEDEDDSSMLSDASSGPPHFPEEEEDANCSSCSGGSRLKRRKLEEEKQQEEQSSILGDTASSSLLICFSKAARSSEMLTMEDFSTTHFKVLFLSFLRNRMQWPAAEVDEE